MNKFLKYYDLGLKLLKNRFLLEVKKYYIMLNSLINSNISIILKFHYFSLKYL